MHREIRRQALSTAVCCSLCWTMVTSAGQDQALPSRGSQATKKGNTNCVIRKNCCTMVGVQKIPLHLTVGLSPN